MFKVQISLPPPDTLPNITNTISFNIPIYNSQTLEEYLKPLHFSQVFSFKTGLVTNQVVPEGGEEFITNLEGFYGRYIL